MIGGKNYSIVFNVKHLSLHTVGLCTNGERTVGNLRIENAQNTKKILKSKKYFKTFVFQSSGKLLE